MKALLVAAGLGLLLTSPGHAQTPAAAPGYRINVDTRPAATSDQLRITIDTPPVAESQVTYVMPSVVPGSYSKKDYGRFVQGFQALDAKGKKLKVRQDGPNLFVIEKAQNLARLEYRVDDTWDASFTDNYVFQPGGTNFDAGAAQPNLVLNHYGLYGYLEGATQNYKMRPYEVTVQHAPTLYAATALPTRHGAEQDVFTADSYVTLADGPILYAPADTASLSVGGARIHVAVVSESGKVHAGQVREILRPMAEALGQFFGQMPVPRYYFLMYFPDFQTSRVVNRQSGSYGAMEHSYSSLYFMPERQTPEQLSEMVREISSHEFLHMLAPLNIHSREIGEFDFRNPRMSQHLWLYEGVTEYFAHLAQVRAGLTTEEQFRQTMREKIEGTQKYPTVSFTEMSRRILEKPYDQMYDNVYQKGALIGWLLDIRIQELTQGKQTLRDVLLALRQKYGPTRSFEDAQLIPEIVALTHPQVQQFFDAYVVGDQPLPLTEYIGKIGWNYAARTPRRVMAFGKIGFRYNQSKEQFEAAETDAADNAFGLQNGDAIVAVNGQPVTLQTAEQLLRPLLGAVEAPARLTYRRGTAPTVEREARPKAYEVEIKNLLEPNPDATPAQQALRRQLLGQKG
ncbi:peptidase M61 [Hymenobacter busanensis]|uniref:Peptidase M61 n=1 Tax=Hymenobacter busanensis TaxID=2607656 RepID=A0A7L4ZYT8_9BACT|nr:peptidase M61 [Hymenobacter busanensis]KAA9332928.1 peptidase M61 [Hymenobacter busanensis]QHJ08398.1 peptidase M61 [Hymenobacter busanensis]